MDLYEIMDRIHEGKSVKAAELKAVLDMLKRQKAEAVERNMISYACRLDESIERLESYRRCKEARRSVSVIYRDWQSSLILAQEARTSKNFKLAGYWESVAYEYEKEHKAALAGYGYIPDLDVVPALGSPERGLQQELSLEDVV